MTGRPVASGGRLNLHFGRSFREIVSGKHHLLIILELLSRPPPFIEFSATVTTTHNAPRERATLLAGSCRNSGEPCSWIACSLFHSGIMAKGDTGLRVRPRQSFRWGVEVWPLSVAWLGRRDALQLAATNPVPAQHWQ